MKVVIEARLRDPAQAGGVAQAVISLASGLSALEGHQSGEEYIFVTLEQAGDWLAPYITGPCRNHRVPKSWKEKLAASPLGPPARRLRRLLRHLRPPRPLGVAVSDGLAEALGADLVHFPTQEGYLTDLPTIYQPHDLQHLHMPQLCSPEQLAWRSMAYPIFCARADVVLVESSWTRNDLVRHLGLAPEKIAVVPFPPATGGYTEPDAQEVSALRRALPFDAFIFYPAQTWPHKNHLNLIEALALLRDRFDMVVPLVCTGGTTDHYRTIQARIAALGLERQVQFLGYVTAAQIKLLYRLCTAVVVPTKFESVSFPVWEALEAGKAVACSDVTSLPAQVGDAGLIFDPDMPASIAEAVKRLWEDDALRQDLGAAGWRRFSDFSLDRTARHVRALYRRVAGRAAPEDDALKDEPPQI